MLTESDKQEIIDRIRQRAPSIRCPMCQQNSFSLVDGYFRSTLQKTINSLTLDGPGVPSAAIICSTCGFISQHALGVLGLLNKQEAQK
jgi:hypothetical protein